MKIGEEIKQEKFTSEYQKAFINILFTSSWLHSENATYLKKHDITPEQYNVLRILRGSHPKPMMLSDVSSRMIDRSSNATRLVEKLRLKGMVKRDICENNRRQVDITITDAGLKMLTKIDMTEASWTAILSKLNEKEATELNRILDKLRG